MPPPWPASGISADLSSDRAVDFIRRHAHEPFLLSVHYTAPHWPWETCEDEAESKRIHGAIHHLDGGSVETYQTMIRHMDEGIGRILACLEQAGVAQDTLVIFTSDNGGELTRPEDLVKIYRPSRRGEAGERTVLRDLLRRLGEAAPG